MVNSKDNFKKTITALKDFKTKNTSLDNKKDVNYEHHKIEEHNQEHNDERSNQ
jgi:hypothetical protein